MLKSSRKWLKQGIFVRPVSTFHSVFFSTESLLFRYCFPFLFIIIRPEITLCEKTLPTHKIILLLSAQTYKTAFNNTVLTGSALLQLRKRREVLNLSLPFTVFIFSQINDPFQHRLCKFFRFYIIICLSILLFWKSCIGFHNDRKGTIFTHSL